MNNQITANGVLIDPSRIRNAKLKRVLAEVTRETKYTETYNEHHKEYHDSHSEHKDYSDYREKYGDGSCQP